jgi:hypothetical protein
MVQIRISYFLLSITQTVRHLLANHDKSILLAKASSFQNSGCAPENNKKLSYSDKLFSSHSFNRAHTINQFKSDQGQFLIFRGQLRLGQHKRNQRSFSHPHPNIHSDSYSESFPSSMPMFRALLLPNKICLIRVGVYVNKKN